MTTNNRKIASFSTPDAATLQGSQLSIINGKTQKITLTNNITLTDNMNNGDSITLMVEDGAGYSITWPTISWLNNSGVAPTLEARGYTVFSISKIDSSLYGSLVGSGMPLGTKTFNYQLFTSSGTWVRPSTVTEVEVLVVGGGGGGSGYNSGNSTERGGDGGCAVHTLLTTSSNVSVTVGVGGAGSAGATGSGSDGGQSSFDTVIAYGGTGGITQGVFNSEPVHGGTSGGEFSGNSHDIATLINNLSTQARAAITQLTTQSTSLDDIYGAVTGQNAATAYTTGGTYVPGTGGKFGNYNQGASAQGGISGAVWVFWWE